MPYLRWADNIEGICNMNLLKQKTFFKNKEFYLEGSFIKIREKTLIKDESWVISYEDLDSKLYTKKEKPIQVYIVFGFMVICCFYLLIHSLNDVKNTNHQEIMWFVMMIFWGILLASAILINSNWKKYLTGGKSSIEFFGNVPNEETVDRFISEVIKKRKEHYIRKFLDDEDIQGDFYAKSNILNWFKKSNIIDENDYRLLKSQYLIEENKIEIKGFNSIELDSLE